MFSKIVGGIHPLFIFTKLHHGCLTGFRRVSVTYLKYTHREDAPENKTQTLKKIMNMGIWVVGTLNLQFIGGSYTEIKFSKK